jgi:hypothetical protein
MIADEFGGDIPVGPFALIGDDSIGQGIVATLRGHRSPAVLMRNHGVFTIGASAKAAVKAAVMCEDVARTVHIARQLGEPLPSRSPTSTRCTSATRTPTGRAHERPRGKADMSAGVKAQVWFLTGSQHLYGPETLDQVAASPSRSSTRCRSRARSAPRSCGCRSSPTRPRSGG